VSKPKRTKASQKSGKTTAPRASAKRPAKSRAPGPPSTEPPSEPTVEVRALADEALVGEFIGPPTEPPISAPTAEHTVPTEVGSGPRLDEAALADEVEGGVGEMGAEEISALRSVAAMLDQRPESADESFDESADEQALSGPPPSKAKDADGSTDGVGHDHLKGALEALIFASDAPLKVNELAKFANASKRDVAGALEQLTAEYMHRGVRLEEIAGGWLFRTNPAYAPFVRDLTKQKPVRLTRAQVETLSILAYRQPITRPEIDDIRGVDSGPVLKVLLERDLIRILGKKDEPGRPMLYGTTTQFLEFFGLKSLKDLPTLKEFTELSEDSQRVYEAELGESYAETPSEAPPETPHDTDPPPGVAGDTAPPPEPAPESPRREKHDTEMVPPSVEGETADAAPAAELVPPAEPAANEEAGEPEDRETADAEELE
jgi:segregation and condensation protein B